ncbi:hypothetical protein J6590_069894 [Homalodisca vitripennis]|nr:hypothetical protein J6590_069894 [Homalodisca vitripennis]
MSTQRYHISGTTCVACHCSIVVAIRNTLLGFMALVIHAYCQSRAAELLSDRVLNHFNHRSTIGAAFVPVRHSDTYRTAAAVTRDPANGVFTRAHWPRGSATVPDGNLEGHRAGGMYPRSLSKPVLVTALLLSLLCLPLLTLSLAPLSPPTSPDLLIDTILQKSSCGIVSVSVVISSLSHSQLVLVLVQGSTCYVLLLPTLLLLLTADRRPGV